MIKYLHLDKFRKINYPIEIKLAKITLLFGLNNVGKSSVIQSLDLMNNLTQKYELPLLTNYMNYGSIESIINKDSKNNKSSIGLVIEKNRDLDQKMTFSFSEKNSNIIFFEKDSKGEHLIKSIEFNQFSQAYFNEINVNRKSYMQIISSVKDFIKKNSFNFEKIIIALEKFLKKRINTFFLNEIKQDLFIELDLKNEELLEEIKPQHMVFFEDQLSIFYEEYKNELIWDETLSNEDAARHFCQIFSDFFKKSKDIKNKITFYDFDKKEKDLFYGRMLINFYERIKIYPHKDSPFINSQFNNRLKRVSQIDINDQLQKDTFRENTNSIIKFFRNSLDLKNEKKIFDLFYRIITKHKYDINLNLNTDTDVNLISIISDLDPTTFSTYNDTSSNSPQYRVRQLPLQMPRELRSFSRRIPKLNILSNHIFANRIYTYKNSNSYLDKIFENKDNDNFRSFVTSSLKKLGFDIDDFNIIPDENSFKIKILNNKKAIDLVDCGTGMKNSISLLSQLFHDQKNLNRNLINQKITFIEEPEANLHPKFQAELGEVIVDICLKNNNHDQILIETHSQNITLRILKLIRNKKISKEDVSFNCLYKTSSGKIAVFTPELLDDGNFIGSWPGGFFDESLYELDD